MAHLRSVLQACIVIYWVVLPGPSWCRDLQDAENRVEGTNLEFLISLNGTYGVRPYTVVSGELLRPGAANLQPSLVACAASCDALPRCQAFNYCGLGKGCNSAFPGGAAQEQGFCELLVPERAAQILIKALASDHPDLGTAGVRLADDVTYAQPAEGYVVFMGRSIRGQEIACEDTVSPAVPSCVLAMSLKEAATYCNTRPDCLAFVFLPHGLSANISAPLASFKGWDAGELSDIYSATRLSDIALTYIKEGAAAELSGNGTGGGGATPAVPPGGSSSTGLSGGAIAGIVVGSVIAALSAAFVGALLWRRRRQHPSAAKQSVSSSPSSKQGARDSAESVACCASRSAQGGGGGFDPGQGPPHGALGTVTGPLGGGKGVGSIGLGLDEEAEQAAAAAAAAAATAAILAAARPALNLSPARTGSSSLSAQLAAAMRGPLNRATSTTPPGTPLSCEAGGSQHGREASLAGSTSSDVLLSRLPDESWTSCIVDPSKIKFSETPGGTLVELGKGAYSSVYRVMYDGVQPYAAKVIELGEDAKLAENFLKEVSTLRQLRHRNVVGFAGVCVMQGSGVILMELMEGRDLHTRLTTTNKTGERLFGWRNRGKTVAVDVARALHYVHSRSFTHFDVKSSNILLTRDLTAKLADVGLTRALHRSHHTITDGRAGTFDYMAPELILGRPCSSSADIFSFGVLLWEICTGEYPNRGCMRALSVPEECPQEVADLWLHCMEEDPEKRPDARILVEVLSKTQYPAPAQRGATALVQSSAGN